jgi:DNA-binding response OmpR family regulator
MALGEFHQSVLCVGNDRETQAMLRDVLSDYEVVFAENAFEALRNVNSGSFHGYVLDSWLPDWSGPALCRELRKIDPHGPIIFCSAAVGDNDKARALRAGANAYLCKPVDADVLRAKLHAFFTLAETGSLQAKIEEQRVIQEELERRLANVSAQLATANALIAASIERTARSRAYKAFIEANGTRAHFYSWWPQVFEDARKSTRDLIA